jgi:3-hydroxyisobutyrate dehydrogenase-like beta-hydroxyacid dehydrogenase
MSPTPSIGTPTAVVCYAGPAELHRELRPVLDALGGTQVHLGEEVGRAAAYDIALLDLFWTAMAGYAHAMAIARAEGITARELLPFAKGIGAILPPIFEQGAADMDSGSFSGEGNPMTSAVASMAHIVHLSEQHGIDAGVMRAAEGMARRAIGLGHGADGFLRIAEVLGRG